MNKHSVKVFLKIKPDFSKSPSVFQQIDPDLISLDNKLYKFDYIASGSVSNQVFFDMTMHPLIEEFLSGESVLILTYGQSESGKTYTLFGGNKEKGVIEKTCQRLIQNTAEVSCRFLEIFQEAVFDLLAATVKDEKGKTADLMTEQKVDTSEDLEKVLEKAQKRTGGGKGHTIFTIGLRNKPQKMVFVDLAGADKPKNSAEKSKENGSINKSLASLSKVLKNLASESSFINYRDSKLTFLLKDWLGTSKLVLISTLNPNKRAFFESLNTLKFSQKLKKIRKFEPDLKVLETNLFLEQKLKDQSALIKSYKEQEENYLKIQEIHSECEKKQKNLNENIQNLETEIRMLRKELIDLEKIGNSDWLLSSDSEEAESYQQISREKSELEQSLAATNEKLSAKTKEVNELTDKILCLEKDREKHLEIISSLSLEADELNLKCNKYQELCVLLGKLNSNLASEVKYCSDRSPELQDLSIMSSTEASKNEVYKIIEEKDAKTINLAENFKITEESLNKLKEKYYNDTTLFKKTIAKLRKELEISKTENIRENQYAMQILEDLKSEKNKLAAVIEDVSDKGKIRELKEINNFLAENLRIKAQQIADLQINFQEFLKEKKDFEIVKKKVGKKKEKIRVLKNEFSRIRAHFLKFPQFRKRDFSKIADFLIENFPVLGSN